jgi:hypothetical protein
MENINKFNKTKIYKIYSNQCNDIYIGSTIKKNYRSRLNDHRYDYKNRHNRPYCTSFELLKYNDCEIELIELCNFQNSKQKTERERYYINLYNHTVNKYLKNNN